MNETGSECNTAPEPAGWSDRPGKRQSPSKKSAGFPVMAKILSCIHSLFGNLLILSCKTESPANGLDSPLRKNGLQKKKKEKRKKKNNWMKNGLPEIKTRLWRSRVWGFRSIPVSEETVHQVPAGIILIRTLPLFKCFF